MDAVVGLLIFSTLTSLAEGAAKFNISPYGSYGIVIDEIPWLFNSSTTFQLNNHRCSVEDGSLRLAAYNTFPGKDKLGEFTRFEFQYNTDTTNITTSIHQYKHLPMAVFSQEFPEGADGTSVNNANGVISEFPSFRVDNVAIPVGVLAYNNLMSGWMDLKIQRYTPGMPHLPGGLYSGPVVLYDNQDNVIIIAAFNHFTANSYQHDDIKLRISWGIMGNVDSVPSGYIMQTMVFYSDRGINQALEEWGFLMRKYYSRSTAARDNDVTVNYLGYYTDNGGYYYHLTEKGMNYEQTLFAVIDDAAAKNIPYKYIQYDDYWYPIETSHTSYGAVLQWEPLPNVFPHGMQHLYDVMKLPVIAHNRYWSYKTPYAKQNNGTYNFYIDETSGISLPLDQAFWDWLLRNATEWGLVTYEQDFLCTQMEKIKLLNSDIRAAEQWLFQMGNAAEKYNLKLQYCMALPRQTLASLQVPAVSQIRVSADYVDADNWRIGATSLLAHVLGLAPFKDNFWTTSTEPGNPYGRVEVNPVREAIVAILSTGPVGVSDKLGLTNTNITRRLCRTDGLLLKPGRPATAIDSQYWQTAFTDGSGPRGEVWSSLYELAGFPVGVVLATELTSPYNVSPQQIGFKGGRWSGWKWMVYALDSSAKPVPFTSLTLGAPQCANHSICVHYLTPVIPTRDLGDVALLGELDKYVPMSPQRVASITTTFNDVTVQLSGAANELVLFHYVVKQQVLSLQCIMGTSGSAMLSIRQQRCQPF